MTVQSLFICLYLIGAHNYRYQSPVVPNLTEQRFLSIYRFAFLPNNKNPIDSMISITHRQIFILCFLGKKQAIWLVNRKNNCPPETKSLIKGWFFSMRF